MKATAALDSPRGALLDGPYSAAIDRPGGALRDRYRTLFDYALRYGHDRIDGGFFCAGPLNATADNRIKVWWIQAEALLSALNMFRVTRDPPYRDVFLQTLRWIAVHQVDWKTGEWFELIDENGKASGAKAGAWKTAYHNGRAVLECLKILREVEAEAVANVS
jgi:mannobiose 2-epimerase